MASPDKTPEPDHFEGNIGANIARDESLYLDDGDFKLYNGEAFEMLRQLSAGSVHCVVTSPPYWGLRDYGTAAWEGGDPGCDHQRDVRPHASGCVGCGVAMEENTPGCRWCADRNLKRELRGTDPERNYREPAPTKAHGDQVEEVHRVFKDVCGKCGARRVDQALGLEATPELYVARMVEVFREVRRVLRGDGVCWVNLGDSYNGSGSNTRTPEEWAAYKESYDSKGQVVPDSWGQRGGKSVTKAAGLKPKDLVGIPWKVAFALQADGWYLRSDVVWSKPNPMPESVTDRPTKSHEYVFLLTKSARYFFDQEAVREPHVRDWGLANGGSLGGQTPEAAATGKNVNRQSYPEPNPSGRNVRSVWEIATQPYPEAHFATYPEELVRRCILAGTSERGCCPECGAPWEREITSEFVKLATRRPSRKAVQDGADMADVNSRNEMGFNQTTTTGWRPACSCDTANPGEDLDRPRKFEPVPCTVLDPFGGSGTTALVARKHGRRSILIELSGPYCELAARRLSQLSLLSGGLGG